MTKVVIIVGVGCVAAQYLPAALRAAGYEPVFLLDQENFAGDSRAAVETCACHRVDIEDWPAVRRLLRAEPSVIAGADAITSLWDEKFPLTQELAARYGLRHPEPAFARLARKAEVARLVPEHCPDTMIFRAADCERIDLRSARRGSAGLILKPSVGTGAIGQVRISAGTLTGELLRDAILSSPVPGAAEQEWLLQEEIEGTLISVEGFAADGLVRLLGYSARTRIGGTEVANLFPAHDLLPARVRDSCLRCVESLTRRSRLRNGYFHCEFVATADDACLIDANIGRIGGAGIVQQAALAHGITPGDILRHVVVLPLDPGAVPAPLLVSPERQRATLSIWYGLPHGGVVRSVTAPRDSRCWHTQFARPGGQVPPVGTSDSAWVGVLTGLADDVTADIGRIAIHTDQGVSAPCYAVDG